MARGQAAPNGAERISQNGYHYTKVEDQWVLTHKIVLEAKLGRKLLPNERVRFKDKDRTNLDPDNLEAYVVRDKSVAARRAEIESKIDELQAELDSLQDA